MTSADARVAVGKVTRVHGVRGEVAVLVLSEVEGRFDPGAEVQLEDGRSLVVEESRPHRGRILVWFRGVSDRDLAERLVQQFLFVPESASPRLPEGSWWDHQLECGLLAAMHFLGWSKTGAELEWWADRIPRALRYLM